MSRKIKFRVWDRSIKKMHVCGEDGHDSVLFDQDGTMQYYNLQNGEGSGEHGDYELMQYTGLRDATRNQEYPNGKDIYEGDIVKQTYITQSGSVHDGTDMTYSGHHIGKVVITARGVFLKNPLHYSNETDEENYMNANKQVAGYRSEVIGNIFEHQHLLYIGDQETETLKN